MSVNKAEILFKPNIGKLVEIELIEGQKFRGIITEIICNSIFLSGIGISMIRYEDIRWLNVIKDCRLECKQSDNIFEKKNDEDDMFR